MITIVAKSTLLPNCQAKFLALAATLVERSQAEEGNLSYHLYQDKKDENVFLFIEEWQDEAAIARHNASDHFTRIVPLLSTLRTGPSEVSQYQKAL